MLYITMRCAVAVGLVIGGLGCQRGSFDHAAGTDQSAIEGSKSVWMDVPSDITVFGFNARAGKLVPVAVASEIGARTNDTRKTRVEYFADSEHWSWIGSVELPLFVRREETDKNPYADNSVHRFLEKHTVRELAKAGLPLSIADVYGGCPRYRLLASGRLAHISLSAQEADFLPRGQSPPLEFATNLGDYVLSEKLVFASHQCLGPAEMLAQRGGRVIDPSDRSAVVLGAGSFPLREERGTFLMLLAQEYHTVYVNDIDSGRAGDQVYVNSEYALRCPRDVSFSPDAGDASAQSNEDFFCQRVTKAPRNMDFTYLGVPAQNVPRSVVSGADVFVVFPEPSWVWGKEFNGEDSIYSVGKDLAYLLDEAATAYVLSEQPIVSAVTATSPFGDGEFDGYGLSLRERRYSRDLLWLHPHSEDVSLSVSFITESGRRVSMLSPLLNYLARAPLYLVEISRLSGLQR